MNMKRYEKYKPSGIEWIGEVPEHWELMPFKFRMDINNGMDYKHIQVEEGYPVMGSGGQFACASKYMYDGEVVLLGRKGTVDKPLYFNGKFWAVDTMFYAIPIGETCCKYMYYQATTFPFSYYQTATALPSMTQTDLGNNRVCVPPLDEQEAIAAYLDARCADIDKVVATQEKRIALLNEMKQSVITQAVTRGLNPDAKMKDSGVEWIGMVPEHWEKISMKYFFYMKGRIGWQGLKADEFIDEGPYLITGTDFEDGHVVWERCYHISQERYDQDPAIHVKKGDLLITKDGTVGKLALIDDMPDIASLNSHLLILRPYDDGIITNKFVYWYLGSQIFKIYTGLTQSGSIMESLSQEKIGGFILALPPIEEQNDIASYLDRRCAEIDKQIGAVARQIELLREYKQSLITDVVTGKVKVC